MFIPNLDCTIAKRCDFDDWGQYIYDAPVGARCSIVKLEEAREKTSVRTDSSASRGNAEEIKSDARLLFPASTAIAKGDIVEVFGFKLRVVSTFPRVHVFGHLDHWQVDAEIEVT